VNYSSFVRCSLVAASIVFLAISFQPSTHAAEPAVIAGTSWTVEGPLTAKSKGRRTESDVVISLFFGPQTVSTESGEVNLASTQFLMSLDNVTNESHTIGTYVRKRNKAKFSGIVPDNFILGLLEVAFGYTLNGTLNTRKFKLKARFQSSADQRTIEIRLKAKAIVSGDIGGEAIEGKVGFTLHGFENSGTIHVPVVLRPIRNSALATARSNEQILTLSESMQSIWRPTGIVFDLRLEETEFPDDLVARAQQEPIVGIGEPFLFVDAVPDPAESLHMFFLQDPDAGNAQIEGFGGFAYPNELLSVIAENRFIGGPLLAHEMGHVFGLGHTINTSRVMNSGATGTNFSTDEIVAIRRSALDFLGFFGLSPIPPKIVFVTSSSYSGDLMSESQFLTECAHVSTGMEAGDCLCQVEAQGAGLTGTFKAWLSDSVESPATRFTQSPRSYVVPRDQSVFGSRVAFNYEDLIDGTLIRPITRTVFGQRTDLQIAWTGTQNDGGAAGGGIGANNCNDWMPPTTGTGTVGQTRPNSGLWSEIATRPCAEKAALYCFEQ